MVVFFLITTSSVPYLLLMVKFFILTGDFCFSIASKVSCLEVAKQPPHCTLETLSGHNSVVLVYLSEKGYLSC